VVDVSTPRLPEVFLEIDPDSASIYYFSSDCEAPLITGGVAP